MLFKCVLIVLLSLVAIMIIILIITFLSKQKTKKENELREYVITNSETIKSLEKINSEFTFHKLKNYDINYCVDNMDYYNDITPLNYLVYYIRLNKEEISKQLEINKYNLNRYKSYKEKVLSIKSFKSINNDNSKLTRLEYQIFNEMIKYYIPLTIKIEVSYYQKYSKAIVFDYNMVTEIIERLKVKRYDEEIWSSLTKVERSKVTKELKDKIFKRDGYKCQICHRSINEVKLEIDHIKPISKGGLSVESNLQTLCHECNVSKGNNYK